MSFFILDSGLRSSKVNRLRQCTLLAHHAGGASADKATRVFRLEPSRISLHRCTHGFRSFGLSMRFTSANFLVFFCLPM